MIATVGGVYSIVFESCMVSVCLSEELQKENEEEEEEEDVIGTQ